MFSSREADSSCRRRERRSVVVEKQIVHVEEERKEMFSSREVDSSCRRGEKGEV